MTEPARLKFQPLWDIGSLGVAFELNFANPLAEDVARRCELYEMERQLRLVRREKTITRLYEPAIQKKIEGEDTFFEFPGELRESACFSRLMLRRRDEGEVVVCARFGETRCFGLSLGDKNGEKTNYLSLAYPGKSGIFVPLYVRLEWRGEPFFLQIMALDKTKETSANVVVRVRKVLKKDVPAHLQLWSNR